MEIYNGNYCVYIHTNKVNAKRYVGITCQKPNRRWKNGDGYKRHRRFYNAIKKYGWDNFEHEIIASNLTESEAKNFEIILIHTLQLQNKLYGYNETAGGEGARGYHHTDDAKEKMSQTWLGKKHSAESIRKMSESKRGHVCSEETKRKIGDGNRGKVMSENARNKISKTLKRINSSEDSFKKKSAYMKGKQNNVRPVIQYGINGEVVAEHNCLKEASKQTGVSVSSIYRGCITHKPVCGYLWEYRDKGGVVYEK